MQAIPHFAIVACVFLAVIGLPLGLYALLTRGQRRAVREIRQATAARGWKYRLQRWQGNPTAFRIDGTTQGGQPWILTSGNSSGANRGWSVQLRLRFPQSGGETDMAMLPRGEDGGAPGVQRSALAPEVESRVARFSGAIAGAVAFLRGAREVSTGFPAFDAAYEIAVLPAQVHDVPVDRALAKRMMEWPSDTITPHSMLAWRDPFAFEFQARLPGPPDWPTVSYFVALGEDLITRVPSPRKVTASGGPVSGGLLDRLINRLLT